MLILSEWVSQVSSDSLTASHECRVPHLNVGHHRTNGLIPIWLPPMNYEQIQLLVDCFSVGFTSFL